MDEESWEKMRPDASDRCDGCGAQAYVISRAYGTLLRWCVHDWRRNEEKLLPAVTELHDYSFLLEDL
jgi:hypothetical protein